MAFHWIHWGQCGNLSGAGVLGFDPSEPVFGQRSKCSRIAISRTCRLANANASADTTSDFLKAKPAGRWLFRSLGQLLRRKRTRNPHEVASFVKQVSANAGFQNPRVGFRHVHAAAKLPAGPGSGKDLRPPSQSRCLTQSKPRRVGELLFPLGWCLSWVVYNRHE